MGQIKVKKNQSLGFPILHELSQFKTEVFTTEVHAAK